MARIFEYAVFKDEKLDKEGEVSEKAMMLVDPTTILADDDKQVSMLAARSIDETHMKDIDRIRVVVRPF